jgi:hypothetical protein
VGHEPAYGDMTYIRYGKRKPPKLLYENIIKHIHFDVDLEHLKQSKFVMTDNTGEEG